MRLRNIPGAREEMLVNPYVVQNPEEKKGHWQEFFGNNHPIHIEIGMGKGQFIMALAAANPDINYLGIEKYSSVLLRALEKQAELQLPNLRFIRLDAEYATDVFDREEIHRIYLNFSDPWPKDRHAHRRLTSDRFLARYTEFLRSDGYIAFKTDNRELFDFSVETAEQCGWELSAVTYDLHHSPYEEGNFHTEYEDRFSALGKPICRLEMAPAKNLKKN
ncbi:MAG: tRNA (guanosine(46)-N7)-methyltransferase TrmB [Lachnospiraceae bacterium]|nr:tRNA (guanosine(46)-N7)-methyltransferase TrmB [Lachnospiraceae bacterium]